MHCLLWHTWRLASSEADRRNEIMKRRNIAVIIMLVLTLALLVACNNDAQSDKLAWMSALEKGSEAKSVEYAQSVMKGDLLLSSCEQKYTKGETNWAYEKTEKTLNEDAYASEKYTETNTSDSVERAPILQLEKSMVESFEEKGEDTKEYDVKLFEDKVKAFLRLNDAEAAKVNGVKLTITVANGRVTAVTLEYKISDTSVQQTLKYAY